MSAGFPYNRKEMLRARYELLKADAICKSCGASIEWWKTTNGSKMPFDPPKVSGDALEQAVAHWATCPNARQHKGTGAQQPAKLDGRAARVCAVEALAELLGALVVVAVLEDGHTWAAKHGLAPEDVKHELITAANEIRREMEQGR